MIPVVVVKESMIAYQIGWLSGLIRLVNLQSSSSLNSGSGLAQIQSRVIQKFREGVKCIHSHVLEACDDF
jgi:hypothetical protein